ncbi:MAG TPA: phosphate signaling complex protein PhoU [Micromonosporaceae bacterium]|jgi:phosphate transport system protein
MREQFNTELAEIRGTLVTMAEAVALAMRRATSALLNPDRALADDVVAADAEIDALYRIVEDRVFIVLARQTPVASDLRLVLTSLHVAADLERMGDLADHVARTARRRFPSCAVPAPVAAVVKEMGEVADRMASKIGPAIATQDAVTAAQLEQDDDAMDELHRSLFQVIFSEEWTDGAEAAVDTALLGRYYERYADHAVNVGRHVVFMVTASRSARSPEVGEAAPSRE